MQTSLHTIVIQQPTLCLIEGKLKDKREHAQQRSAVSRNAQRKPALSQSKGIPESSFVQGETKFLQGK